MAAFASPARRLAVSLSLAVGVVASAGRAEPLPATPLSREPAVILPPRPDPVFLELGVRLGGGFRIGDAPSFPITSRTGFLLGVGVAVAPSPRFSVGLAYEHAELGTEHSDGDL